MIRFLTAGAFALLLAGCTAAAKTEIVIAPGPDGFTVHFDSKKIDAAKICEAIKKGEPGAKIKT